MWSELGERVKVGCKELDEVDTRGRLLERVSSTMSCVA